MLGLVVTINFPRIETSKSIRILNEASQLIIHNLNFHYDSMQVISRLELQLVSFLLFAIQQV